MIRRVTITSLATMSLSIAVLGWVGYAAPLFVRYQVNDHLHFYLFFADGLVRAYWYSAGEPIDLDVQGRYARVTVRLEPAGTICQQVSHAQPGRIAPYAVVSTTFPPRPGSNTPPIKLFGVRTWTWLPIVLLIAYPALAVLADRLRRRNRREGHCRGCGYNLTGNASGVCSECGLAFETTMTST